MSARLAAFLAWILGQRRPAPRQLASARRRAAWESIELTLDDLRHAA